MIRLSLCPPHIKVPKQIETLCLLLPSPDESTIFIWPNGGDVLILYQELPEAQTAG